MKINEATADNINLAQAIAFGIFFGFVGFNMIRNTQKWTEDKEKAAARKMQPVSEIR